MMQCRRRSRIVGFLRLSGFVAASSLAFSSNSHSQPGESQTGTLTMIARYVDVPALDSVYQHVGVPLVVLNEMVFLPSAPCVEPRRLGGATEERRLGGDTEDRQIGGATEERRLGGEKEERQLGGDTEKRDLAGAIEERQLGGEKEDRQLGGGTEKRDLAGGTEDRRLGGDTEKRDLGGATEERELGGEKEDRHLGGDTEHRDLGGGSIGLRCATARGGFQILNPPHTRIQVYDGTSLREVENGLVLY
jgi:hypothetical protein